MEVFLFAMNALTVISTDLLTPLGAYLKLREGGRASFLLESVERGRLGRHSFVGCGSRLISLRGGGGLRPAGRRLPRLRPRGGSRADRRAPGRRARPAREPLRRRGDARALRPRGRHAEVLAGDPGAVADLLDGPLPDRPRSGGRAGSTRRLPSRHAYERSVVRAKEHIRAGDAFQIVLSQRAERPTSASALGVYRSLRRVNPSPYLFLLESTASRSSAPRPKRS